MAGNVAVEKAAIQGGMQCCTLSAKKLGDASKKLQRKYQQAGSSGWRDKKYAELGSIIEECCRALTNPIKDLEQCKANLDKLYQAVVAYDETRL